MTGLPPKIYALPYEESGATRDLDGGLYIVLVVGLLLIHAI
jgi:hypothetical protein